jgi:leucyl/phenylalanyl-tRNA--protein transferase
MLYLLDSTPPDTPFPNVEQAETEPNGLLAVGGDLTPQRLVNAYRRGVFPWYNAGQPILWWSPDPRLVLFPERLHVSRSLRKTLRRGVFRVTMDRDFDAVIHACAAPRAADSGTWLVEEMILAYLRLHQGGLAHSVEVWAGDELAGGLYGVSLGRVFFGESMFSRRSDASKVATWYLTRRLCSWGYRVIDCQMYTEHLVRLGAEEIPRRTLSRLLATWTPVPGSEGSWRSGEPSDTRHLLELLG